MKTDKLEKFVIENRDQFDTMEPNPALWQKIEASQTKKIDINWTRILVRAAAVVVIFVSSYIFFDHMVNKNQEPVIAEVEANDPEDIRTYQELMEAEYYYTSMIENRTEEFIRLTGNNSPLRKEITIELKELDKVYRELKEDLKDNADNEEVVVAMIQNYRLKLEILEEILLQLQPANENTKDDENKSINM
ncbi:MAG: hypothetical protein V2I62_08095 [Bacteroidales bacterium]|jgi:hypothetical protein|nr:hypothetical protein [Bacteroidales bacterium]